MINTKEVIQKYNNGSTIKDLALENGISDYKMNKFLIKNGVTLRTRSQVKRNIDTYQGAHRTHSLNEEYFNEWSNNMAYWLGFIYADGNVIYNEQEGHMARGSHVLTIGLKDSDAGHLEKFKKAIDYTGEVRIRKTTYTGVSGKVSMTARIDIHSKNLVKRLVELGVVPNKSLIVEFPEVPKEYELDFIRGFFDGDGSVDFHSMKNPKLRTRFCCGNKEFMEKLRDVLHSHGMKKANVTSSWRKNLLYEIAYSEKESLKFFELMYKSDSVFLDRKYKRYEWYKQTKNIE